VAGTATVISTSNPIHAYITAAMVTVVYIIPCATIPTARCVGMIVPIAVVSIQSVIVVPGVTTVCKTK